MYDTGIDYESLYTLVWEPFWQFMSGPVPDAAGFAAPLDYAPLQGVVALVLKEIEGLDFSDLDEDESPVQAIQKDRADSVVAVAGLGDFITEIRASARGDKARPQSVRVDVEVEVTGQVFAFPDLDVLTYTRLMTAYRKATKKAVTTR